MCSSSRRYEDILAPRRAEMSNFMWVSRALKPQVAFKQDRSPSPQYQKDQVLNSAKVQELLETLSRQKGVSKEALEVQVSQILDEIGYEKKLKVIRWLGLVIAKICQRTCSGIYVNRDALLKLKCQMGTCPVIFVPSHRSYADFILLSYVCFTEDLAIPAIAAGMDFHGMWGMGTVLRDTGAFFMRRSYNDDSLYWTTFKQYVYQLVTKGELPIEFFIEGTRSRSNKSITPKYGLILMILKAFFLSQVPDIWFVPINISYDRILEEKLFAFELLGIPKPKESTLAFFKSLSIVKEKFGSIYFDVAEPISAKEFFGDKFVKTEHNLGPIHQQEISDNEKKLIPALAHEIVYKQQQHCVITTFNLLAIVLHSNLFNGEDSITVEGLIEEVFWLKKIIQTLGGFVENGDVRENIFKALDVHKNLVQVTEDSKVTLIWSEIQLDKSSLGKLKAHELSQKTLTMTVPFIMLQLYINPVLHYIVDVAILVVVLKHGGQPLSEEGLFSGYHFLRRLLAQEFITFSSREKMDYECAIKKAIELNLISKNEHYQLENEKKVEDILYNCIDGFVFTYFIVCVVILQFQENSINEKTILSKVQAEVEVRLHEKHSFIHPYSLSLDTISNCLATLVSWKALTKTRRKGIIFYEINSPEVLSVKNKLEQYVAPAQLLKRRIERVQFHLKNKL